MNKNPIHKKILHVLCVLTFVFTNIFANSALAGSFHYQIDVMTQLLTNPQHQLNTVQMSWLYDEKITNMLLQDEDIAPAKRQQTLETVGDLIMTDLQGLNYFTQLKINNKPTKITHINNYSVELIDDKYLRLLFTFPLPQPVDTQNTTLSISLADPNGAAMLFYDTAERITIDESDKKCAITLLNYDEFEHGKAAQRVDIVCK